jgi:predicted unusual protein kinase regulating ubiquinone biosynthesis (AarF/ABC1/UbiB family)
LGPAYVKVAQAISTRVDILSPAYLIEIERLQDKVPPFPTSKVGHFATLSIASTQVRVSAPADFLQYQVEML